MVESAVPREPARRATLFDTDAEVHWLSEILSEDFEHGRHYGTVRAADPFLAAADRVNELPPLYAT